MMTLEELQHLAIGDLLQHSDKDTNQLWQVISKPEYHAMSDGTAAVLQPNDNYSRLNLACAKDNHIVKDHCLREHHLFCWTMISKAM